MSQKTIAVMRVATARPARGILSKDPIYGGRMGNGLTVHPYEFGVFGGGCQGDSESRSECCLEEEHGHDERPRDQLASGYY